MKISQEDVILIKNLYLSKQNGARRLLNELPDKGWKVGSTDSLLLLLLVCVSFTIIGQQRNSVLICRV